MPSLLTDRAKMENPNLGSRLDSWKEIATYLRRGERTVKRWETDRGLPIHRVPGGGRGSVYAYTAELAEWLKSSPVTEREPEEVLIQEFVEEAESEDISAASAPASLPAPVPLHLPLEAASAGSSPRWKWIFAFAGLVLVGIAGAAVQLAALHHRNIWISSTVSSIFAKSRPKVSSASSTGSQVISDSEKRQARDLYLKGRYEWNQRTPDSLNRALDSFTQSVVHDPGYAPAYVGLADTYDLLREYSTMEESDAYPRAIAAARKAVELDDSLAEAHRALAFSEFYGNWDFVNAEKEFRRSIQLNPNDPVARRWYANAFAAPGRFQESLEQIDKAQELDPTSHSTLSDKGIMLFQAGKKDEGIALLKEVERTDPEFLSPHVYLMYLGFELRDYPAYLEEGEKAAEITNDPILKDMIASARAGYARDGERGLLKNLYVKQKQYYVAGKLWGTILAKTCVMMGRKQEALQLLEEGYAHRDSHVLFCLTHLDLLTLKDEPRYKALVKKINFPGLADGLPGAPPATEKSSLRASY
jgi:tetratricopeptide (TPR) repeat protein